MAWSRGLRRCFGSGTPIRLGKGHSPSRFVSLIARSNQIAGLLWANLVQEGLTYWPHWSLSYSFLSRWQWWMSNFAPINTDCASFTESLDAWDKPGWNGFKGFLELSGRFIGTIRVGTDLELGVRLACFLTYSAGTVLIGHTTFRAIRHSASFFSKFELGF